MQRAVWCNLNKRPTQLGMALVWLYGTAALHTHTPTHTHTHTQANVINMEVRVAQQFDDLD